MPNAIIRPNITKSKSLLPSPYTSASNWTGTTNTVAGDNSDASFINTPNNNTAKLASYWNLPNQSWGADTIIGSITVVVRARYTATTPTYNVGGFLVNLDWSTDYANNNLSFSFNAQLSKDVWTEYNVGTFTTKTNGQRWTKAEIDAMALCVFTEGNTPAINNYQVQISDIWLLVTYSQIGVLTGNNSTVNDTTTPSYSFSFSHPEEYLGSYEAKLFEYSETVKPGFNWLTSNAYIWSSGIVRVSSFDTLVSFSIQPDVIQNSGHKYAMYCRASPKSLDTAYSNTAITTRIIDIRSSIAPRLVLATDNVNKRFSIDIWREDNLLSDDQSLFTTGLGGWAVLSGSPSLSWVSSTGYPSVINKKVLSMNYTGSSAYSIACGTPSTAYANTGATAPFTCLAPGEWHSFAMRFWTIGTAGTEFRNARLDIHWFDSVNTLISTAQGNVFKTLGSTWVYPSVTAKAPANCAKYAVVLTMTGATGGSEFHVIDCMDVHIGNVNVLENSTFDRDIDGDSIPDNWAQYNSGAGTAAIATIVENDESVFAGERVLKISKPTTSQKTEDGVRQTIYSAKNSVVTTTVYVYSLVAAIVRITNGGLTGTQFTEVTLTPGVITPVSISGTQSASTMTALISIGVRSGWTGGDVYISFCHAEPKPVDNSVSIGTIPSTIGKDRLSNFSPGGVDFVQTEFQYSQDRGLSWKVVYDQEGVGELDPLHVVDAQWSDYDDLFVHDYLQPLNKEIWYRARQFYQTLDSSTGNLMTRSSQWSKIMRSNVLTAITRGAWLKSTSDPSLNRLLAVSDRIIDKIIQKTRVTRYPLNSKKAIVISGIKRAMGIPFSFYCRTENNKQEVRDLLDSDETLFLQMPKFSTYVNLNGDYTEKEFVTVSTTDSDDTVISGIFQEVRDVTR